MEFNISSKEDINKIKKFVKDFGGLELRDQYCHLHDNLITFYIGHNYWYTNVSVVLDTVFDAELFLSFDLETFTKAILKFPEVASIKLDQSTSKITIYGETKKNKISMKYKEESEFCKNDVLNRGQKFEEAKLKEPTTIQLSDKTFERLNKIERIGFASTIDLGTVRITNKRIEYANKMFIYVCENEEPNIPEDNPIYINVSTIPILKAARSFGVDKFNFAKTNKFVSGFATNFELIASQKKLNFNFPTDKELEFFAPTPKEDCWIEFNTSEMSNIFKEFKNVFTENSWRWEPLTFTFRPGEDSVTISYSDIKVSEERDLDIKVENNNLSEEYSMTLSSQLLNIFLNDSETAVLTFTPLDVKSREPKSIGVTLSLSDQERAVFTKLKTI